MATDRYQPQGGAADRSAALNGAGPTGGRARTGAARQGDQAGGDTTAQRIRLEAVAAEVEALAYDLAGNVRTTIVAELILMSAALQRIADTLKQDG